MRVDRSGSGPVRRCGKAVSPPGAQDRAPPALPDVQLFSFDGNFSSSFINHLIFMSNFLSFKTSLMILCCEALDYPNQNTRFFLFIVYYDFQNTVLKYR